MRLIDDWKDAWKFWSVQLGILGTVLTSVLLASPDAALMAWGAFPDEFKQFIPPHWMPFIGVGIFACSMVARVIQQQKLHRA
jgi:hypothetical protein